jgi:hypothetical protein
LAPSAALMSYPTRRQGHADRQAGSSIWLSKGTRKMKQIKRLMFALVAMLALTGPAFAQAEGVMRDNTVMFVAKNGKTTTMATLDKAMMDTVVKEGKLVSNSMIFVMAGGKLYMIEDRKMADGKMLSEHLGLRA